MSGAGGALETCSAGITGLVSSRGENGHHQIAKNCIHYMFQASILTSFQYCFLAKEKEYKSWQAFYVAI